MAKKHCVWFVMDTDGSNKKLLPIAQVTNINGPFVGVLDEFTKHQVDLEAIAAVYFDISEKDIKKILKDMIANGASDDSKAVKFEYYGPTILASMTSDITFDKVK